MYLLALSVRSAAAVVTASVCRTKTKMFASRALRRGGPQCVTLYTHISINVRLAGTISISRKKKKNAIDRFRALISDVRPWQGRAVVVRPMRTSPLSRGGARSPSPSAVPHPALSYNVVHCRIIHSPPSSAG
jgi:hypothetical protein